MKRIFQSILIVFVISYGPLLAVIYHEIDTTSPLKCLLSSMNQNRVVVEDGRIKKVIFLDERIVVQTEEESGQVFIYPLEFIENSTTVSIITEKGSVQDLEIQFENRSSEVVILKEKKTKGQQAATNSFQNVSKTIETILEGVVPQGYVCLQGTGEQLTIRPRVIGESIARFEGEAETIYFYRIINRSRKQICLSEEEFNLTGNTWTYLDKSLVGCKEETFVLIAVKR